MQIAGSSAIVVGGAGGLGEATVRRLHGAGAKVVVADLADDKGKALESEARQLQSDLRANEKKKEELVAAARAKIDREQARRLILDRLHRLR